MKRLAITLLTTGCLLGTYGLYALWVTPMVQRERPAVKQQQPKATVEVSGQRGQRSEISTTYLPNVKWAADSLYQFREGNRYIFTEKWERTAGADFSEPGAANAQGEIEFTPFAMVVLDDKDPDAPPYTLVSRSAVLRFENGFGAPSYNPGRIVGGSLNGEFEIRGPEGLYLRGPNLVFQENQRRDVHAAAVGEASPQVYCDGYVQFEYQGHHGTGHGLDMKLIPDHESTSSDKPAIAGIETIRLRDHVEMHLLKEGKRPGRPDERVQINSEGPFVFDMISNTVSFHDDVRVVRLTEDSRDTLDGDVLHIVFNEVQHLTGKTDADGNPRKGSKRLEFSRLLATVSDPERTVVLTSQSARGDVTAKMKELTYDGDAMQVVMKDNNQVHVHQKNNEFYCPELTLNHNEHSEIVSILGRGAGHMISRDPKTNAFAYRADWQKQIWKRPASDSNQQVLDIEEGARLVQFEKMAIEARLIRVWFEEERTSASAKATTAAAGGDPISGADNVKIQRMMAADDVLFGSLQLIGTTKKLKVWFEEGTIPEIQSAATLPPVPRDRLVKLNYRKAKTTRAVPRRQNTVAGRLSTPSTRPSRRGPAQAFASTQDDVPGDAAQQPQGPPGEPPPQELAAKAAKPVEPILVDAEHISVRVIREGEEHHVADVVARGNVTLDQKHEDGAEPLAVDCHQLNVQNQDPSNEHQIIWIFGVPATGQSPEVRAHVRDRGMHLEGLKIKTDRLANQMRVDGAGLMQRPVGNTLDGRTLQTPEMLSVWWNDKMEFDGTLARFFDKVRIVHEDSTVTCGQMDVTLTNPVSFIERKGEPKQQVEIRKVVCREGVRLDSQQFEGNRLIGKHRGEIFELSMDQVTGEMESVGGGWFEYWQRNDAAGGAPNPSVAASSNRAIRSSEKQEWNYTKINFRGGLTGNVSSLNDPNRTATTEFRDDVVVVHGPVKQPNQVLEADDLPPGGGTLDCARLRLRQLPASEKSAKRYITMLATGNVHLSGQTLNEDGQTFWGRADEVTYDESNDQYVLRTAAKQGFSEMWRQSRYQGKPAHSKAQQLIFYPKTGDLRMIGGSSLDVQN